MGCKNGKDHQDWKDEPSVFNTIVSFKSQVWSEKSVFLWQLSIKVAVE